MGPRPAPLRPASSLVTEQALNWFARLRGGPPTLPVQVEFALWLDTDPAHAAEFDALLQTWEACEHLDPRSLVQAAELPI